MSTRYVGTVLGFELGPLGFLHSEKRWGLFWTSPIISHPKSAPPRLSSGVVAQVQYLWGRFWLEPVSSTPCKARRLAGDRPGHRAWAMPAPAGSSGFQVRRHMKRNAPRHLSHSGYVGTSQLSTSALPPEHSILHEHTPDLQIPFPAAASELFNLCLLSTCVLLARHALDTLARFC